MSRYILELLWPNDGNTVDNRNRSLVSQDLTGARFEAATIFAQPFEGPPPTAYRLLQDGDVEVYRYP